MPVYCMRRHRWICAPKETEMKSEDVDRIQMVLRMRCVHWTNATLPHSWVEFVWVEWSYVRTFPSIQLNYRLGEWCIDDNGNGVWQSKMEEKFREFSTFGNWFHHKKTESALRINNSDFDSVLCSLHCSADQHLFDSTASRSRSRDDVRHRSAICNYMQAQNQSAFVKHTRSHTIERTSCKQNRKFNTINAANAIVRRMRAMECIGVWYLQCDYDIGLNIQIR